MAKDLFFTINDSYHKVKKNYITTDGIYRRTKKIFCTENGIYKLLYKDLVLNGVYLFFDSPNEPPYIEWWNSQTEYLPFISNGNRYTSMTVGIDAEWAIPVTSLRYDDTAAHYQDMVDDGTGVEYPLGTWANDAYKYVVFKNHKVLPEQEDFYNWFIGTTTKMASKVYKDSNVVFGENSVNNYIISMESNDEYAILVLGYSNADSTKAVDKSLTITEATSIESAYSRAQLGRSKVGNYALFAGGRNMYITNSNSYYVDAYDTSLVHTLAPNLSAAKQGMSSAELKNYALFFGGTLYTGTTHENNSTIEAYDSTLSKTILSETLLGGVSAYVEGHAIILDGPRTLAKCFDESLSATTIAYPVTKWYFPQSANAGRFAIFAGGTIDNNLQTIAYAYDNTLACTSITPLGKTTSEHTGAYCSASLKDRAIFANVSTNEPNMQSTYVYDSSLTLSTTMPIASQVNGLKSVTIGDYALFGGWMNQGGFLETYSIL